MKHESPRDRRLRSDHRAMEQLRSESTILNFRGKGTPPESYLIVFRGVGLWRPVDPGRRAPQDNGVITRSEHQVRIELGASYPRMMPGMNWVTPIFHPNISSGGVVCLGEYGTHWVPSLDLVELCHMLWDMIRYENYDVDSPYNRDAATWARAQSKYQFPVDPRPLRDKVALPDRLNPPQLTADSGNGEPEIADVLIIEDDPDIVEAEVVDETEPDQDILFLD